MLRPSLLHQCHSDQCYLNLVSVVSPYLAFHFQPRAGAQDRFDDFYCVTWVSLGREIRGNQARIHVGGVGETLVGLSRVSILGWTGLA